jgi:hypothetical protein
VALGPCDGLFHFEQLCRRSLRYVAAIRVPSAVGRKRPGVAAAHTASGGGVADFERYGISGTALLRINYPVASCPEQPSGFPFPSCPSQDHVVGTAQTNGTNPTSQTSGGKPVISIGAGRQITAFADEGHLYSASAAARG